MPMIEADGCPIHVEVEGPADAPALMLSNSLGTTLTMWDPQARAFAGKFRLIRYDRRGHGRSGITPGPYTMERLGRDVLAILDALGVARTSWCGLSMGGMVGQWLGANAPERMERIILSNTSCYYADKEVWNGRIKFIREKGLPAIVDGTMERWFTKGFRERSPQVIRQMTDMLLSTPVDGYVACCEAVRDMDHRDLLAKISVPTLIIAGTQDPATTMQDAEYMRARIKGARLAPIDAAHISNIEQPDAFTRTALDFLTAK
ncbi:MAG: 3-oxoadipate enol-lactonase [Alphaproteobacteria bacterium]|nr:MAG: 3-oxoadipate enol-lactonase [Alphaproteobacteria bacterium]